MLPITSPPASTKKLLISRRQLPSSVDPTRTVLHKGEERDPTRPNTKKSKRKVRSANCRAHSKSGYAYVRPFSLPRQLSAAILTPGGNWFFFPGFLGLRICFLFVQLLTVLFLQALILPGALFLELVNPSNSHDQQARNASSHLGDWTPFLTYSDVFKRPSFHSSSATAGSSFPLFPTWRPKAPGG